MLGVAGVATISGAGAVSATDTNTTEGGNSDAVTNESGIPRYELPPLPYEYDALEPAIDTEIMRLHHDEHHQGYVEGQTKRSTRLKRCGRITISATSNL
jgi:Fe-Mn family superoxide dismutase